MTDSQTPGAEFYYERLARAKAVPEAQRSADVRLWLRCHDELEAAFALLPPDKSVYTLTAPAGGKPALAALLRVLAAAHSSTPNNCGHPEYNMRRLGPQLPPLMQLKVLWSAGVPEYTYVELPALRHMLDTGRLPAGHLQLELVARALLLGTLEAAWPGWDTKQSPYNVLQAIKHTLFDQSSAAELTRQLAELEEECGSLPWLEQLQAVWLVRANRLADEMHDKVATPALGAAMEETARNMVALQPNNPRSHYLLGAAAFANSGEGMSSVDKLLIKSLEPLPHYLRGLELARQQGSDFWIASCGWPEVFLTTCVVRLTTSYQSLTISPLQAQQMTEEADAAWRRCKHVLPYIWLGALKREYRVPSAELAVIRKHAQRSLSRWRPSISQELGDVQKQDCTSEEEEQAAQTLPCTCDGCGHTAVELKQCTACRAAKYCSRACQVAAWPSHMAAIVAHLAVQKSLPCWRASS